MERPPRWRRWRRSPRTRCSPYKLRLPGIYSDELLNYLPAKALVDGGARPEVVSGTGPALTLGGHSLQLMMVPYFGSLKTAILAPFVAVFGVTPSLVRLVGIAMGLLALAATYLFGRRLFRDSSVAALAVALLAVDPSFFFYSRMDWGPTDFMLMAKGFAGWQLLRWWDSGSRWALALGSFAAGLGVWDKLNFGWIVASAALGLALVAGREVARRLEWNTVLVAGGGFVLGALPLIAYNLRSHFASISAVGDIGKGSSTLSAFPIDEPHAPSGGLLAQLGDRLDVLWRLLDGQEVARALASSLPTHFAELSLLFALGAIVVAAGIIVPARGSREARVGLFLLIFGAGTLLAAAATGSAFHGHHVILVYPVPHMLLALALVWAARRRRVLAVLAALALSLGVAASAEVIHTMDRTDGRGLWSARIYDLERYATQAHARDLGVGVDWGLAQPLWGLSQGKLRIEDPSFVLEEGRRPAGRVLAQSLRDPHAWYVLHSRATTVYPGARRRFFDAVRADGKRAKLVRTFRGRKGAPLYEVYEAVRG